MRKRKINPFQLEKKSRSGLEDKARLILHKHKIQHEYEPKDKKVDYVKPATKHKYLPDLIIEGVIYELKGYMDSATRLKMECVLASNPNLEVVMVFQKDQPIRKGAKTTYTQWCDKQGLKWMMFSDFEKNILKRHNKKNGK